MIIGLAGKNGSGKGEFANVLRESGFIYHSLSDVIRSEIKSRSEPVTRDRLVETGTALRKQGGPSVLADKILAQLDPEKNYVIDSIRNPAEVQSLRRRSDFALVEVSAPQRVRFERIVARKRESDPATFEDFVALEKREDHSADPDSQQMIATIALANHRVVNDGTLEELKERVRDLVRDLSMHVTRPNWDEYFMNIAKVAALRSNCMKRKVAAVIAKDKRIISTGYNGTPRGIKNCNEGGCPRCNAFGASGADLGECLCSHAEENSIVQSAYHGVSISGATLYTTFSPCLMCTKMIINSGIREVVFNAHYPMGDLPLKLLSEARVQVRKI